MELENLIMDLENMPGPDRKADRTIARFIGMQNRVKNGEEYWVLNEVTYRRVPAFTFTVDGAFLIGDAFGLNDCGACTFGKSSATAMLAGEDIVHAATPAIALCIAYLKSHLAQLKAKA